MLSKFTIGSPLAPKSVKGPCFCGDTDAIQGLRICKTMVPLRFLVQMVQGLHGSLKIDTSTNQ